MATSSKRAYAIPRSTAPEPLPLQQSTLDPYLLRRHSDTVLSQSLWGLWILVCTRYVSALWASVAGMGFDSKCDFTPPTVLLGLLLCPWTWGISSKSLQHQTAVASAPTILLGLLCPWTWDVSLNCTLMGGKGNIQLQKHLFISVSPKVRKLEKQKIKSKVRTKLIIKIRVEISEI